MGKMRKRGKRILAYFLTALMVFSLLPAFSFKAKAEGLDQTVYYQMYDYHTNVYESVGTVSASYTGVGEPYYDASVQGDDAGVCLKFFQYYYDLYGEGKGDQLLIVWDDAEVGEQVSLTFANNFGYTVIEPDETGAGNNIDFDYQSVDGDTISVTFTPNESMDRTRAFAYYRLTRPEGDEPEGLEDGLYFGDPCWDEEGWPLEGNSLSKVWGLDARSSKTIYLVEVKDNEITPVPLDDAANVIFKDYYSGDVIPVKGEGQEGYSLRENWAYDNTGMPSTSAGRFDLAVDNPGTLRVTYGGNEAVLLVTDALFTLYPEDGGQGDPYWDYFNFSKNNHEVYVHQIDAEFFNPEDGKSYRKVAKDVNVYTEPDVITSGDVAMSGTAAGDYKIDVLSYNDDQLFFNVVANYTEEIYVWNSDTGEWALEAVAPSCEYRFPFSYDSGYEPELEDGLYLGDVRWSENKAPEPSDENLRDAADFSIRQDSIISVYLRQNGENTLLGADELENFRLIVEGSQLPEGAKVDYAVYRNGETSQVLGDLISVNLPTCGVYTLVYHEEDTDKDYSVYLNATLPDVGIYSDDEASEDTFLDGHGIDLQEEGNVYYLLATDAEGDDDYTREITFGDYDFDLDGQNEEFWDGKYDVEVLGDDKIVKLTFNDSELRYRFWFDVNVVERRRDSSSADGWREDTRTENYEFEFYPVGGGQPGPENEDGLVISHANRDESNGWVSFPEDMGWFHKSQGFEGIKNERPQDFCLGIRTFDEAANEYVMESLTYQDLEYLTIADSEGNPANARIDVYSNEYWPEEGSGEDEPELIPCKDVFGIWFEEDGMYTLTYSKGDFTDSVVLDVYVQPVGLYSEIAADPQYLVPDGHAFYGETRTYYVFPFDYVDEQTGLGTSSKLEDIWMTTYDAPSGYLENHVFLTAYDGEGNELVIDEEGFPINQEEERVNPAYYMISIADTTNASFDVNVNYVKTNKRYEGNQVVEEKENRTEIFRFDPKDEVYATAVDDGQGLKGFTGTYVSEYVYRFPEYEWSPYDDLGVKYYVHGETIDEVLEVLTSVGIGEYLIGAPVSDGETALHDSTEEDGIINTGYIKIYPNQYGDKRYENPAVIHSFENVNGILIWPSSDERYVIKPDSTYTEITGCTGEQGDFIMLYVDDPMYMYQFFNEEEWADKISADDKNKLLEVIDGRDPQILWDGVVYFDGNVYLACINVNHYVTAHGDNTDYFFTIEDDTALFAMDKETYEAYSKYIDDLKCAAEDGEGEYNMTYYRMGDFPGLNAYATQNYKIAGPVGNLTFTFPEDYNPEDCPEIIFMGKPYVSDTYRTEVDPETGETIEIADWIHVDGPDTYPEPTRYTSQYWQAQNWIQTVQEGEEISSPKPVLEAEDFVGVHVTWGPVNGVSNYRVLRKIDTGSWKVIADVQGTEYLDKTGTSGKTCIYAVRCLDEEGNYITNYDAEKTSEIVYPVMTFNSPTPTLKTVDNYIKVSWSKVTGVSGYRVFRKAEGGNWKKITDVTANSYEDKNGTVGTKYYYAVRCLDADGNLVSAFDNKKVAESYYPAVSPNPLLTVKSGKVQISWGRTAGVTNFRIFRKAEGGNWKKLVDVEDVASYLDATGVPNTTYTYAIRCLADDKTTLISPLDNNKTPQIVYPKAELQSPMPVLKGVSGGIEISWEAEDGITNYKVYRRAEGGSWKSLADVAGTNYTDTKGTQGAYYDYAIRCLSEDGTSILSKFDGNKIAGMVFPPKMSSPKPTVTRTASGVTIEWDEVIGADSYRVFYKYNNGSWKKLSDTDATSVNATVKAGTYVYAVRCMDASGKLVTTLDNSKLAEIVIE